MKKGTSGMVSFLKKFGRKEGEKPEICSVIVPAAGSSTRMEGLDKILVEVGGMPILAHTLKTLNACDLVHEIILVTREELMVDLGKLCKEFDIDKATKVLIGGVERSDSVLAGLHEVREDADIIAIHDGARPFLSQTVLETVIREGRRTGAAAPAVPVIDTIKEASKGLVEKTLARDRLWAVQTPQVFESSLIKAALEEAVSQKIPMTDDCSAVERLGMKVTLTEGSYENIKITTPLDLALAQGILMGVEE